MAGKISLETTIGGAYGFLLGDLVSVIGIVWLPYLLFGALAGTILWYGFLVRPLPPLSENPLGDLVQFLAFFRALALRIVPAVACLSIGVLMATLGLTRKALGKMQGLTLIYFNLGANFWRLIASYLLATACFVLAAILFHMVGVIWATVAVRLPHPAATLVSAVGVSAALLFYIYAAFRVYFFIPAVVAAEDRIGLMQSWRLGRGNFWRIVVVLLLIVIPSLIVYAILDAIVRAIFFGQVLLEQQKLFLQLQAGQTIHLNDVIHSFVASALSAGPVGLVLAGLLPIAFAIATRALYAGAAATAYLGLTEK